MFHLEHGVFSPETSVLDTSLALSREAAHRSSLLTALTERREARRERRTVRSVSTAVARTSV